MDEKRAPFPHSMALYRSAPSLALCLPAWEAAMGTCFHFELAVRLLAQKHFAGESVTRDVADGKKGKGLLTLLFERLDFSVSEKLFLPKCNTLRNKLIHCEPDAVAKLLQELAPDFRPPNTVHRLNFAPDATGADMAETIRNMTGAVRVQDTSSREDGFLGWMMQAAHDGTFELACEVLRSGMVTIDGKAQQR